MSLIPQVERMNVITTSYVDVTLNFWNPKRETIQLMHRPKAHAQYLINIRLHKESNAQYLDRMQQGYIIPHYKFLTNRFKASLRENIV